MIIQNTEKNSNCESGREVAENGIVHFDATLLRRDRMRAKSQSKESTPIEVTAFEPVLKGSPAATSELNIKNWKERVQSVPATATKNEIAPASLSAAMATESGSSSKPSTPSRTSPTATAQEYKNFLVAFVVEQTGYPEEIVDLEADLEADLGIDSIKIAQMMGELTERFQLDTSSLRSRSLDDFKTLGSIVRTITSSEPFPERIEPIVSTSNSVQAVRTATPPEENQGSNGRTVDREELSRFLIQFVVEQTGYPEDIVEMDADLEADLGIDSIKIAQMLGEVNETFDLDLNSLRGKSTDDFRTLSSILASITESGSILLRNIDPSSIDPASEASAKTTSLANSVSVAPINKPLAAASTSTAVAPKRDTESIRKFLIDFVVEQTGYPEDIVELDADLEADLGIDSIKIAQMLGELNERFEITMSEYRTQKLDDIRTLRSVIDLLSR